MRLRAPPRIHGHEYVFWSLRFSTQKWAFFGAETVSDCGLRQYESRILDSSLWSRKNRFLGFIPRHACSFQLSIYVSKNSRRLSTLDGVSSTISAATTP